MKLDPYLQPHIRYYMREIRVVVYSQVRGVGIYLT